MREAVTLNNRWWQSVKPLEWKAISIRLAVVVVAACRGTAKQPLPAGIPGFGDGIPAIPVKRIRFRFWLWWVLSRGSLSLSLSSRPSLARRWSRTCAENENKTQRNRPTKKETIRETIYFCRHQIRNCTCDVFTPFLRTRAVFLYCIFFLWGFAPLWMAGDGGGSNKMCPKLGNSSGRTPFISSPLFLLYRFLRTFFMICHVGVYFSAIYFLLFHWSL